MTNLKLGSFYGCVGNSLESSVFKCSVGIYTFETEIKNKQTGTPIQDVVKSDV